MRAAHWAVLMLATISCCLCVIGAPRAEPFESEGRQSVRVVVLVVGGRGDAQNFHQDMLALRWKRSNRAEIVDAAIYKYTALAQAGKNDVLDRDKMRRSVEWYFWPESRLIWLQGRSWYQQIDGIKIGSAMRDHAPYLATYGRHLTLVYPFDRKLIPENISVLIDDFHRMNLRMEHPRAIIGNVSVECDFVGAANLPKVPNQQSGAKGSYAGLPRCQQFLPFGGLGRMPLGLQVGIVTLVGAAFLGCAAIGCARVFSSTEGFQGRDWIGWGLIVLGFPIGLGLYSVASLGDWRAVFWLCEDRIPYEDYVSDKRNDAAPTASNAAIRNHAGNAPRLIFTVMEPSVSGIPASVNRFASSVSLGMPSGYRGLLARDRVGGWEDTGRTFTGGRFEKPHRRLASIQGAKS